MLHKTVQVRLYPSNRAIEDIASANIWMFDGGSVRITLRITLETEEAGSELA